MFEKYDNAAYAEFDLCAAGPVLVGSGQHNEIDVRLPDDTFLSGSDGEKTAFIIPGSTIKGLIRNYIWKAKELSVSAENDLFGTVIKKAHKSRISFYDAYADMDTVVSTIRYQTAINPILQNAKTGSLRNMQVVEKGVFNAGFRIINFNKQELSSISKALDAINKGTVRIGGKTSRGFGRMTINNFRMRIVQGFDDNLEPIVIKKYNSLDEYIGEMDNG